MSLFINWANKDACLLACIYRVGQKTGLFLRADNFEMTNDKKAFDMSKFLEFCLE